MKFFTITTLSLLTGCCTIPPPKSVESFCLTGVQCKELILDNSLQIKFFNTAYTRSDDMRGIFCKKRNSNTTVLGVFCTLRNSLKDTLQIQFDKFYLVYADQVLTPEPEQESVRMRTYTYHSYYKVPPFSSKDFVFKFIIDSKTLNKADSAVYFVRNNDLHNDTLFQIKIVDINV